MTLGIETAWLDQLGGFVDGRWLTDSPAAHGDVINPATGEVLGRLPQLGGPETVSAIEAADRSLRQGCPLSERRRWLEGIHDGLAAEKEAFGRIITLENGKPLREAVAEVEYTCGFFRFFSSQIGHLEPTPLPGRIRECDWTILHRPAGVAGLITPWNFPLAMQGKKLAPALAAGCGVVIKPAPQTPLSMIALCRLAEQVGVPRGWINLVIGAAAPIGRPSVPIPRSGFSVSPVRRPRGDGSPPTRRRAETAPLELGGNAPFVVFEDADRSRRRRAVGQQVPRRQQTCVCANRVLVQQGVAARFTAALADRVAALRVGNGLDADTDVGPLISQAACDKVAVLVRTPSQAERGASSVTRRSRTPAGRGRSPPTLLTDVTRDMRICREEIFGPVIAVTTFADETGAVEIANQTTHGLAAYVFSSDPNRLERMVQRLRFGHVGLNTGTGPTPEAPFGGFGDSGFGREGGLRGLSSIAIAGYGPRAFLPMNLPSPHPLPSDERVPHERGA
jgi:succinate-semialdehyde dehydrogenase/glutarate-semialdehyde dehydrogenase